MRLREGFDRVIKPLSMLLALSVAIVFLGYFVITNNSYFILYSFPLFVLLGIFGSFGKKLSTYEIVGALSFITAGSILYIASSSFAYYGIFSIIAFIAIYIIHLKKEFSIYLYSFFALPDLLYSLGFWRNQNFAINAAIIGYYLLIAAVLSIFLSTVFEDSRNYKAIEKRLSRLIKERKTYYVLAAISLVILVFPVWPTGITINTHELPSVKISTNNSYIMPSNNSGLEYISVLMPHNEYLNYTDSNFSNAEFFYQNGKAINATLHEVNETFNYTASLEINKSMVKNQAYVYLYFMPLSYKYNGTTYGHAIISINKSFEVLGPATYYGRYVTRKISVPITKSTTTYRNISVFVAPYYQFGSYCAPGFNITYSTKLNFSSNMSFFELKNSSDFISAIGNYTGTINSLMASLKSNSFGHFINTRHVDTSFPTYNSCMFYVLVSQNGGYANGTIISKSQVVVSYKNETVELPNLYSNISDYLVNSYSSIGGAASYLMSEYENYTRNSSK